MCLPTPPWLLVPTVKQCLTRLALLGIARTELAGSQHSVLANFPRYFLHHLSSLNYVLVYAVLGTSIVMIAVLVLPHSVRVA